MLLLCIDASSPYQILKSSPQLGSAALPYSQDLWETLLVHNFVGGHSFLVFQRGGREGVTQFNFGHFCSWLQCLWLHPKTFFVVNL